MEKEIILLKFVRSNKEKSPIEKNMKLEILPECLQKAFKDLFLEETIDEIVTENIKENK